MRSQGKLRVSFPVQPDVLLGLSVRGGPRACAAHRHLGLVSSFMTLTFWKVVVGWGQVLVCRLFAVRG
jgi:hypothetical protein